MNTTQMQSLPFPGRPAKQFNEFSGLNFSELTAVVVSNGSTHAPTPSRNHNPFGHALLKVASVDRSPIYFHVAGPESADTTSWGTVHFMNAKEYQAYIQNGGYRLNDSRIKTFRIYSNHEQNEAKKTLLELIHSPHRYLFGWDNCLTFVTRVLKAANIYALDGMRDVFYGSAKVGFELMIKKDFNDLDLPTVDFDASFPRKH